MFSRSLIVSMVKVKKPANKKMALFHGDLNKREKSTNTKSIIPSRIRKNRELLTMARFPILFKKDVPGTAMALMDSRAACFFTIK